MDLSKGGLTTLAWEGHKPHLSAVFTRLQLHSSLVDVSLTCATGQTVRCHKVLLAAASPYFQKLFSESGAKVGFSLLCTGAIRCTFAHLLFSAPRRSPAPSWTVRASGRGGVCLQGGGEHLTQPASLISLRLPVPSTQRA